MYESPHRLLSLLQDMQEVWGNRRVAVARELTKIHEEVKRGLISEVISHYEAASSAGEITVVVEGYKRGNAGFGPDMRRGYAVDRAGDGKRGPFSKGPGIQR